MQVPNPIVPMALCGSRQVRRVSPLSCRQMSADTSQKMILKITSASVRLRSNLLVGTQIHIQQAKETRSRKLHPSQQASAYGPRNALRQREPQNASRTGHDSCVTNTERKCMTFMAFCLCNGSQQPMCVGHAVPAKGASQNTVTDSWLATQDSHHMSKASVMDVSMRDCKRFPLANIA